MRRAVFPTLILLLLTSVAYAQRGDNIVTNDGKTERGEIVEISPKEVTVMIRNRATPIEVSKIKTITFEKEPSAMRAVREAIADGQLDQAVAAMQRIVAGDIERDVVKQELAFLQARVKALQAKDGSATPAEATAAMQQFFGRHPKSWRAAAALESLGDLAMQTGDSKGAATHYFNLAKISSGVVKLRSTVRSADALRTMGDAKNAMKMYGRVRNADATTPAEQRQQTMATVGAMALAAAGGKAEQAITALQKVIADNDASDVELFGRAYNALGDCYRSANKPTDAALAYLHTCLLYTSPSPRDATLSRMPSSA